VIATVDVATGMVRTLDSTLLRGAYEVCMSNGTACSGPSNASPKFSKDGRRIAFVRVEERAFPSTNNPLGIPTRHGELVVMNADGTGIRVLDLGGVSATDPVWAPDGSRLLFTSYVAEYVADRPGGPANNLRTRRDVYSVAVDGTDLRPLTNDGRSSAAGWANDNSVRILRFEGEGAFQGGGVPNWWRIDGQGGGAEQLTFFDAASSDMLGAGLESGNSAWFSRP
jgi:Tol biopolymer transport system component